MQSGAARWCATPRPARHRLSCSGGFAPMHRTSCGSPTSPYVPTAAGFLFLAVVLDVFSRRVVGWAMATHLRTELVLEALEMARMRRRPVAVIHHSDQGAQYTSVAFGTRCREAGVQPSTGSVGDCYDNALAERFFATLECELIERSSLATPAEAKMALFDYIEGWYNPHRRHSSIDYQAPINSERRWQQGA